jgi:hypothetical protein
MAVHNCWICDQAIRAGGFSFDFGDDLGTSGSLDKMLQDENAADTPEVQVTETAIEQRIREALGIAPPTPPASGDLTDVELGEPEDKEAAITSGNLVDDADMDDAEMQRRLLGGAPSASRIRNYW